MASYYYAHQQHPQHQHHNHTNNHHNHQHHPPPPSTASQLASSAHQQQQQQHHHHGGRARRAPRLAGSQHPKQFRGVRSPRDIIESPLMLAARARFEAGRSFDLDDDLEYCPGLLTEDDIHSIHSSSTDGSMSSGSPDSSPSQSQLHPIPHVAPTFSLPSATSSSASNSGGYSRMKIHQPAALRASNAIPIVNPSTGMRLPSPPSSVSPGMMQPQQPQSAYGRRW